MLYLFLRKEFHGIGCEVRNESISDRFLSPLEGEMVNPALEAIKGLPAEIHGAEVRWLEVPTVLSQIGPSIGRRDELLST